MRTRFILIVSLLWTLSAAATATGQTLDCSFGDSEQWGSGWCDLNAPTNLAEGLCLRLSIGGTANKILVREKKGTVLFMGKN